MPRFAKRSWLAFAALHGAYKHVQLRLEFRPESFDGIILLSGERDDLTGDFMALLLNKGFVEFWFDCGSGVGSVRSRETIMLNEWNSVIIYRHRWDAWLVLNHGTKVQGRSNVSSALRECREREREGEGSAYVFCLAGSLFTHHFPGAGVPWWHWQHHWAGQATATGRGLRWLHTPLCGQRT